MKEDLTNTIKILEEKNIDSIDRNRYSQIYILTNENQEVLANPNFTNNKNILTVLGSGDQVLNLLLGNAKTITTFDKNILAKYYFDLKRALILTLDYQDYLNFFFPKNIF